MVIAVSFLEINEKKGYLESSALQLSFTTYLCKQNIGQISGMLVYGIGQWLNWYCRSTLSFVLITVECMKEVYAVLKGAAFLMFHQIVT